MLWVRKAQIEAFKREAERAKILDLCKLLPDMYPGLALALGEKGIRRWVEKGAEKAGKYGICKFENITRFIHLMFSLVNEDFDTASETAWAGTILGWNNAEEGLKLAALEKRARMEAEKAQG